MTKHVVYCGSKEVWQIFRHTKLRSVSESEMSDWLLDEDFDLNADRYEFETEEAAMDFVRNYRTYTEIQQAYACKILVTSYAAYEQQFYFDDNCEEYDCCELQYIKCSGFTVASSFLYDTDKMYDFVRMSKKDFLESYSYLTEDDYDLTSDEFEELDSETQAELSSHPCEE